MGVVVGVKLDLGLVGMPRCLHHCARAKNVDGEHTLGLGALLPLLLPWCLCQCARANLWRCLFVHGFGLLRLGFCCGFLRCCCWKTGKVFFGLVPTFDMVSAY